MLIRKATIPDSDSLFNWTNEPDIRAISFQSKPIPYKEHVAWFTKKLESETCRIFIGTNGSDDVGVVRYESVEEDTKTTLVSISIAKNFRGFGYGSELLLLSLDAVFSTGFCQAVHAFVKNMNNASCQFFEKSGFLQIDNSESAKYPESRKYRLTDIDYWTKVLGKKCIAVIPARGGSKRIPLKNIKPFKGKPIIEYSISAAKASSMFARIVISTDSDDITNVAQKCGAEVPFKRPASISDDFTPLVDVLIHAAENVLDPNGHRYKYLCCMLPTAPFITSAVIVNGFRTLKLNKASVAFSVTAFPSSIFRAFKKRDNGSLQMMWPQYEFTRSNDLPETYHDAGQLYWLKVDTFLKNKKIFTEDAVPIIISRKFVQDIDTPEDWEIAELMFDKNILHNNSKE